MKDEILRIAQKLADACNEYADNGSPWLDKPFQMDLAEQNIRFSDYKTMPHVELRRRRLLIDGGKK